MAQRITLDSPSVYQQLRHDSIGEVVLEVPRRQRVPIIDVHRPPRPPRVRLSDLRPRPSAYLSDYPDRFQRYAKTATGRSATLRRGQRLAIRARLVRLASRCLHRIKSSLGGFDTKKLRSWYNSPLVTKILIAMSVIIFITGMTISIRTLNMNNRAVSQIGAMAEATASGTSADDASDVPVGNSSSDWAPSEVPLSSAEMEAYSVTADLPRSIAIPAIGLSTIIKHAGVDNSGAVDVPRNVFVVNWYDQGAKPGDPAGAMLLTGHFSGPRGAGAFHEIEKLNNGDIIEIEQGDGTVFQFQVVEKIVYELADTDMTKAITSVDSSKLGLNLMTCDGHFDYDTRTYDQRLLVRAVKV